MKQTLRLVFVMSTILGACAPYAAPAPTSLPASTPSPTASPTTAPPTATPTAAATLTPTQTASPLPTETPTPTETISQLLKSRIVFYLLAPEQGRSDACGSPSLIPIISKRHRTGDKLRDMQIGLQMLFDLGVKYYGPYYNALWDTNLTINSVEYRKKEDYAIIDFGGFLPVMQMSKCDKRGTRNQIWKTFFHYEFKEKTFTINGAFLIDQLNR